MHDSCSPARLRRLLAEPLFHFFVVGAFVFGSYWLLDKAPDEAASNETIEINADDIRQIVIAWMAQGRSPLTPEQLQRLIDQKIADEVLFREGLALGLDRNDEIIKRRIVQKMDFLAADIAALQEPDKATLMGWFSQNADRFAQPRRVTFRQLYFSPDQYGATTRDVAVAALDTLAGKPATSPEVASLTNSYLLRPYYSDITQDAVLKEFGPDFSAALFTLAPGGWRGPVPSGYGWHLVWIEALKPGRIPAFEEAEADIRTAWIDDQYQDIKRAALEEMWSHYTVDVVPLGSVDFGELVDPKVADAFSQPLVQ